jgi:hypothetical protein
MKKFCYVLWDAHGDREILSIHETIESAASAKREEDENVKLHFINRETRIEEFQLRSET